MAGIGFDLQRAVATGGYVRAGSAYVFSAVLTAGPWVSATLSLAVLDRASAGFLGKNDRVLLLTTITYTFFISLVMSYGIQMVVTRYLADSVYLKRVETLLPTCFGVLCCGGPIFVISIPFLVLAPFPWGYRLMAVTLLITLSLLWQTLVFLSAMRDYVRVAVIFFLAYALSLGAALGLGRVYGVFGSLTGFTAGQVICLALLISHVYAEYRAAPDVSLAYASYLRRYWDLFLIGTFYGVGLSADSVVYWFSPGNVQVHGFFHLFPYYDSAKLFGYLLTIPAASVFLVQVETRIYRQCQAFLPKTETKRSLAVIRRAKAALEEAMWSGVLSVFKVQGIVAFGAVVFAPILLGWLGLPSSWASPFRVVVVAASLQYVMLVVVLLLLYLDERQAALVGLGTFVGVDIVMSEASVWIHPPLYGVGYLLAAATGLTVVLACLYQRLRRLEYATFMLQPFG